ncbi:MAG: PaaI family thioesterase [Burkholderiales bacterium]|nr:PaaI family thioesterase [Burkholderiales bacterium]
MTRRTLEITWAAPAGRHDYRDLTGLQFLRGIVSGEIPPSPMSCLFGFDVVEAEEGRVLIECLPGEQFTNLIGIAHGGLASTLLDSCMGSSIQSTLPAGAAATTLELKINFVRPISLDTGKLLCEGRVIHPGRRVATAQGRVTDASGTLYAHGTTTMMVFPLKA